MITTLLVVYLVSVLVPLIAVWWEGLDDIDLEWLLLCLCPVVNTFLSLFAVYHLTKKVKGTVIIKRRKQ